MKKSDAHPDALRYQFGAALRRYRGEGKDRITQEQLAETLGVTPRYAAGLERAEHNISLDTIDAIAEKLGLSFTLTARAETQHRRPRSPAVDPDST